MKRRCLALGASLAALMLGPTGSALASSDATQGAGNSASAGSANSAQTG
jgi:hypothetical protein